MKLIQFKENSMESIGQIQKILYLDKRKKKEKMTKVQFQKLIINNNQKNGKNLISKLQEVKKSKNKSNKNKKE